MIIRKGILKSFSSTTYTAVVQLEGSDKVYLEGVTVCRNIAAAEMTAGRGVVVVFFDEFNAKEAVVAGVFVR